MKKRRRKRREVAVEASYVCDNCGEEVVIPVDHTAGESQEFILRFADRSYYLSSCVHVTKLRATL